MIVLVIDFFFKRMLDILNCDVVKFLQTFVVYFKMHESPLFMPN